MPNAMSLGMKTTILRYDLKALLPTQHDSAINMHCYQKLYPRASVNTTRDISTVMDLVHVLHFHIP